MLQKVQSTSNTIRDKIAKIKWKKVNGEIDSEDESYQLSKIFDGDL